MPTLPAIRAAGTPQSEDNVTVPEVPGKQPSPRAETPSEDRAVTPKRGSKPKSSLRSTTPPKSPTSPKSPKSPLSPKKDLLKAEKSQSTLSKQPNVPTVPAPPAPPPRTVFPVPPTAPPLPVGMAENPNSSLNRALNSSMGRQLTFVLTIVLFLVTAYGISYWDTPERGEDGSWALWIVIWISSGATMFTVIPALGERTGITYRLHGWKPYFVFWRASFLLAIPALLLLGAGFGRMSAFGSPIFARGGSIAAVKGSTIGYFEAVDGFVALNLTKGVIKTLGGHVTGEKEKRYTRFRDAKLRINKEPFSDVPEPTVPPDAIATHVIAPIFAEWVPCVSRYRMSATCIERTPVIGWAYTHTWSLCSNLRSVACKSPAPVLEPLYQCSNNGGVYGSKTTEPIGGLCGRATLPPPEDVLDEFRAIMKVEGWDDTSVPNATAVWVDVTEEQCINTPDSCLSNYVTLGALGALLSFFVVVLNIAAAVTDFVMDKRIRKAVRVYEASVKRRDELRKERERALFETKNKDQI
eukprot:gnl/TRDRNA2_/TRDRNA2_84025_c0_seq2.p1 gnl/TRDRNA2_/TRDRNA2_84025_c0~~gnl/TRDRNA2_/TRDRNA2_84025_c0_seq2.p1  ORF type:complete len:524 (+),score=57.51 gnl/TRDRNA2_/TRDRNA2_84025_c0_seq2:149-1720(+)